MANFTEKIKNLLIPQKSQPVGQPAYGTDCRAIEVWAQEAAKVVDDLIAFTNGLAAGGYASLTGPGQTHTPGALTQQGPWTVHDSTGGGITETTTGNVVIESTASTGTTLSISAPFVSVSTVIGNQIQLTPAEVKLGADGTSGGSGGAITLGVGGNEVIVTNSTASSSMHITVGGAVNFNMAAGGFNVIAGGNTVISAGGGSGSPVLGFYGALAVTKAAAPSTLADVITILTNLGLCS